MKILLVDDEAQVLRGVSRMIESEMDDWEVETATSGLEALERLDKDKFNVVVSDMRMPGMDGAELLETIELRFPDILRIVLSGQADRESVMRAIRPMHQYLSKPCDPQTLIEVIRRAEVFQETISNKEVLDAIGKANCLPALPTIVHEINDELDSESSTPASLFQVVSKDPMLCGKVLQLANSAIFGLRHPVVDVERGLSILGTEMVRSIALSLAIFNQNQKSAASTTRSLFDHCTEVANIGRYIAMQEKADADTVKTVFSGGILHDAGKVVLLNAFENRYLSMLAELETTDQSACELEMNEFGASHAGVGAYLMESWGLPATIIEAVALHHSAELCSQSPLASQIVYAANWIARGADEGVLQVRDFDGRDQFSAKLHTWHIQYLEQSNGESDG